MVKAYYCSHPGYVPYETLLQCEKDALAESEKLTEEIGYLRAALRRITLGPTGCANIAKQALERGGEDG